MRDVQLNGQPLLVEGKSTEFGLILRRQGVTMGCHSSACSSQPCYSPFLCVDLWRKYECRYIKLLFSYRGGWEAFSFHLSSGNLLLTVKIPAAAGQRGAFQGQILLSIPSPIMDHTCLFLQVWYRTYLFHHFFHGKKVTGQWGSETPFDKRWIAKALLFPQCENICILIQHI